MCDWIDKPSCNAGSFVWTWTYFVPVFFPLAICVLVRDFCSFFRLSSLRTPPPFFNFPFFYYFLYFLSFSAFWLFESSALILIGSGYLQIINTCLKVLPFDLSGIIFAVWQRPKWIISNRRVNVLKDDGSSFEKYHSFVFVLIPTGFDETSSSHSKWISN